ncbi:TB2/DP1/HVA22-related protein family-containing protein [Strongyloides ratti]|uniref:Receptor expression-enhancing protein n=1 Tax=Strongyloides ratti TaxID=34506 RepID=A0A090N0D2_STRRB|nr:TB2/DP1/HVA22-related protein family-containing protein [Strongyloides ratti]CEF70482.1 TB2/DP1/HVA22-related protein family-containing protein [Strongyloides ratti]
MSSSDLKPQNTNMDPPATDNNDTGATQGFNKVHGDIVKELYKDQNPLVALGFKKFEETTGKSRETLVYGICGIVGLYLCLGSAAQLLCNIIGFGYPCYKSIKAVKTEDKEDDTRWLMYWCVFGWLTCIDFFADGLFGWFPLYYLFKTIFLLYLALPYTDGAVYFYKKYAEPIYEKINEFFDKKTN